MMLAAVCFAVAAALYGGFQWTIRLVVYPQQTGVGTAEFVAYERSHQRRVSMAVGPLFAALVLTSAAVALLPPAGTPLWPRVAAPVLVLALLVITALAAVPQHRVLSAGFDAVAHRRLLRVDSWRLLIAILLLALACYLLLG